MTRLSDLYWLLLSVTEFQAKAEAKTIDISTTQSTPVTPWAILLASLKAIEPQITANKIDNESAIRTVLLNSPLIQFHMDESKAFRQLVNRFFFSLHLRTIIPCKTLSQEHEMELERILGFDFFSRAIPAASIFWTRALLQPIFDSSPIYAAKLLAHLIPKQEMREFFESYEEFRFWFSGHSSSQKIQSPAVKAAAPLARHEQVINEQEAITIALELQKLAPLIAQHFPLPFSGVEMRQQTKLVSGTIIDRILQTPSQYPQCSFAQLMAVPAAKDELAKDPLMMRVLCLRIAETVAGKKASRPSPHFFTQGNPTLTAPGSLIPNSSVVPQGAYRPISKRLPPHDASRQENRQHNATPHSSMAAAAAVADKAEPLKARKVNYPQTLLNLQTTKASRETEQPLWKPPLSLAPIAEEARGSNEKLKPSQPPCLRV